MKPGRKTVHSGTLSLELTQTARQSRVRVGCSYRQRKTPVNNLENYPWQTAYVCAILETNKLQLIIRIADARQAIEVRLRNPTEIDGPEHLAIEEALKVLLALKRERLTGQVDSEKSSPSRCH